ncbi:DUF2218 domain-containing protein [Rhodovulum kholense]|uniref:2,4-dihydroxyhept-2-ene-1,7-dioic acid aldolase n=1 Tax=Rhodovulum kholense TaxID=453584 RepID=A0A8E2VLL7_9RHOB|nr:DUF2218 domain-containing protein [Rhodovulum kholense]PTW50236.1 hypothetical protein C8N38_105195 [Rhodovulum kholense]
MALLHDTGVFATQKASSYLQQLCKHFAHKVEVEYDADRGRVALPPGEASLEAADGVLSVTVSGADAAALELARNIVDSHLARFAFREGFEKMDWNGAKAA